MFEGEGKIREGSEVAMWLAAKGVLIAQERSGFPNLAKVISDFTQGGFTAA